MEPGCVVLVTNVDSWRLILWPALVQSLAAALLNQLELRHIRQTWMTSYIFDICDVSKMEETGSDYFRLQDCFQLLLEIHKSPKLHYMGKKKCDVTILCIFLSTSDCFSRFGFNRKNLQRFSVSRHLRQKFFFQLCVGSLCLCLSCFNMTVPPQTEMVFPVWCRAIRSGLF